MAEISPWWQRTAEKLWYIGKFMVPSIAAFEVGKWFVADRLNAVMDYFKGLIAEQLGTLMVDLAPSPEVQALLAKANLFVPISEAWNYLLLYLAIASTFLGVKWARNLIPGIS